jgi:phthiodiolone/phenolphthiodiolone dimycocerosates ketoreductase
MLERPFIRAVALYSATPAFERYGAVHPTGGGYMPGDMTATEALAAIDRIPIEVARDAILAGSIDDVSERLGAYEEAGCEHVIIYDIGRYLSPDGVSQSRACLAALARR